MSGSTRLYTSAANATLLNFSNSVIISNKTNSVSLYANKSIATEGDIVNFSSENNELNVITKDVSFQDTEWDDLVVATARVEGGQVGSNNVLIANSSDSVSDMPFFFASS